MPATSDAEEPQRSYDEIVVADLLVWLSEDAQTRAFDTVVSADVFVYFGDLAAPLRAAARAL